MESDEANPQVEINAQRIQQITRLVPTNPSPTVSHFTQPTVLGIPHTWNVNDRSQQSDVRSLNHGEISQDQHEISQLLLSSSLVKSQLHTKHGKVKHKSDKYQSKIKQHKVLPNKQVSETSSCLP